MYDIIDSFIGHDWVSTSTGEQGYILAISCIVLVVLVVIIIDLVSAIVRRCIR